MSVFLRNSLFLGSYTLLVIPLGYVLRIIYANQLSVTEFGLFFAIISFFGFVAVFNDLGFSDTQAYFLPRYLAKKQFSKVKSAIVAALINQVVTTSFFLIVFLSLATLLERYFFKVPESAWPFQLMTIYFVLADFLSNLRIIFFAYQEAHIYGSTEPVRLILTLICLLLLFPFFPDQSMMAIVYSWIIAHVLLVVIYSVVFYIKHGEIFSYKLHPLKKTYGEFIPFMIPTALRGGASIVLANITVIMLTILQGVQGVALYNVAQPIAQLLMLFLSPITSLLSPILISFNIHKKQKEMQMMVSTSIMLTIAALAPFAISLAIYTPQLIDLFFGSKYLNASLTLAFFSLLMMLMVINNLFDNIITSFGVPKQKTTIVYTGAIVNIISGIVLISYWGAVGAVWTGILAYSVMIIMNWQLIKKTGSIVLPLKEMLTNLLLMLVFLIISLFTTWGLNSIQLSFVRVVIGSIFGGVIYLFLCYSYLPTVHRVLNQVYLYYFKKNYHD